MGAGGHARVVIDVARASGFDPVAALDPAPSEASCNGVNVAGGDEMAEEMLRSGITRAVIAIGDNELRAKIGANLRRLGFCLPALIHPSACVSASAQVGQGSVVMPMAVINAGAQIGELAIINSGAIVEHDCRIGNAAHIAPGSVLGGCVTIGAQAFMGIGTTARPNAIVGERATVGAGSTVIGTVAPGTIVTGTPARARSVA
jgi:sugar O-acyltransferase, sialic acid O-acetyltransferase NeuD family